MTALCFTLVIVALMAAPTPDTLVVGRTQQERGITPIAVICLLLFGALLSPFGSVPDFSCCEDAGNVWGIGRRRVCSSGRFAPDSAPVLIKPVHPYRDTAPHGGQAWRRDTVPGI
jgi:hypothetical protein